MRITNGRIPSAQKVLIYGPEGIGKSTLAAEFPTPLFIDVEGSTKHLDVSRLDAPESWTMLLEEVRYVILNPGICDTLVIDTADWAERLCIYQVCAKAQKDGIEDFGYGKGYTYLAEEFGNLLNLLTEVVEKGVHVVLTAHAQIRKFEQPDEATAYDRWELKLQKKTAPLCKEWADMVLFANYKTFAVKNDDKKAKVQGGKRTLFTSHKPAWDAKNRADLPDELALEDGKGKPVMPAELFAALPARASNTNKTPAAAPEPAPVPEGKLVDVPAEAKPAKAEKPVPPVPESNAPAHLKQLRQLMKDASVRDSDVQAVVFAKGYYPESTAIADYDVKFVEGVLIGAWPQVLATIQATAAAQGASTDTPFSNQRGTNSND